MREKRHVLLRLQGPLPKYQSSLVFSLQLIIFSTSWLFLLFCTLRLFLWPPHSKGTFNKHHRAGLPTLCSQNHFPWTNSVWHCAQAQEKSYERFAQLPSVLLDWSILSSMLPLFSSSLIQLSFAAKFFWVDWMLVNGLFVAVSALSAFFMEHGCYSQCPAWQSEPWIRNNAFSFHHIIQRHICDVCK